jgi:hypothetical protein
MNALRVSPDGFVTIGSTNEWFSLEAIQQAVLEATNPGLRTIKTSPGPNISLNQKRIIANVPNNVTGDEECLSLPTTLRTNATAAKECTCGHKPSVNTKEESEALVMPSSHRRNK